MRTTPAHPVAAPHLQASGLKYQESKSVSFRCRLVAFAELPYSSLLRQLVHRPVLKPLSLYHDVGCAVPASSSIGPARSQTLWLPRHPMRQQRHGQHIFVASATNSQITVVRNI